MITANMVKELREMTGAGMMDCKKVLTETNGDEEKAIELLRERGIAKAAKKAGRVAAEGLVEAYTLIFLPPTIKLSPSKLISFTL